MNYQEWNQAIYKHYFRTDQADELVRFFVEPRSLRQAAKEHLGEDRFESDNEVLDDFVKAVRVYLQYAGWSLRQVFKIPPDHLGLLAIQVLAGHSMRDGEVYTSNAYWPRLRELLGQSKEPKIPDGLTYDQQIDLWVRGYEKWLNLSEGGRRGIARMPSFKPDAKRKRYVTFPLAQVLLRKADLDNLWKFYATVSLQAGENLSVSEVDEQLAGCIDQQGLFSQHARRILFNRDDDDDSERYLAACDQIAEHLSRWDGEAGRRPGEAPDKISQRVWIHWHQDHFTGGLLHRDGRDWRLDPNSPPIHQLLQSPSRSVGGRSFWLFVYDEGECRYLNKRSARPGERVIIVAPPGDSGYFDQSLRRLNIACLRAQEVRNSPRGWVAYQFSVPQVTETLRFPLDFVKPGSNTIHLSGGLKLRRNVWMVGAGPIVEVIGQANHVRVLREGGNLEKVTLANQRAVISALVDGDYSVWVPGERRFAVRFRVRRPVRRRDTSRVGWAIPFQDWPVCVSLEDEQPGLIGMFQAGVWPDLKPTRTKSVQQSLLRLAMLARLPPVPPYSEEVRDLCNHPHPLVRALALRSSSRRTKRDV